MANLTAIGPQPLKPATSNLLVTSNTVVPKRSTIDLLPDVNQTQTLAKFFNATVDHLLQPENVEFINGYIGSKPPYYNSNKDFYVTEYDQERLNYQLPVTAVSIDQSSGSINNVMFYDDIINQLGLQGANVSNPSRLLDGDYYSWSPPIDIDKFVNYYEYYWVPDGPDMIQLLDTTDLVNLAIGAVTYTYTGRYYLTSTDTTVTGSLVFTSGMRIQVIDDIDYTLNNRTLIIEGVGRSIKIKDDIIYQKPSWDTVSWDTRGWSGDDSVIVPDYMTIGRLSTNINRWSWNNRWFHKDVLALAGTIVQEGIAVNASRPIIEFNANIDLYNFGSFGRPDVDLVDTTRINIFETLVGSASGTVDDTTLIDGMRILVTADLNPQVNNRIYEVGGIVEYGLITLTLVSDGQNTDGSPAIGDCAYVTFGVYNSGNTYWYNGTNYVVGQAKVKYQPPLFAGYDKDGINLIDPAVYPGSNFTGTTIFTYAIDITAQVDSILGLQIKRDQFGDYVFDNSLTTRSYSYIENSQLTDFNGYIWYRDSYIGNGWYNSGNPSKQYIINSFDITTPTTTFLIDQIPADYSTGSLPPVMVYLIQNGNSYLLFEEVNYTVSGRIITLTTPAAVSSRIEIRSWSANLPSGNNGYYQLPINLVANPNNNQPTNVSFNETIKHFTGIISNQYNEQSNGVGNTNWRDSTQNRGLGLEILQHRSPLLKLMMLNSNNINTGMLSSTSLTDPSLAIQFAQREYNKFYNRFIRTLFKLYSTSGYDKSITPQQWIDAALSQVNLGKSKISAWAYSGYEQNEDFSTTTAKPTFVPPTATKLGVAPAYKPVAYLDSDYYPPKLTLQTHDGARIILEDLEGLQLGTISNNATKTSNPTLLTNPVASAWLQFELDLYNAIPSMYSDIDAVPAFDVRIYTPGKWRTTDYTRKEYLNILRPSFSKWIIHAQVDYMANTGYSPNNQFSFNYSNCVDKQGNYVPGHWRGIYRYFYDTDRPHTNPWEMLGFSQQPTWWISEYGPAPYTKGNTHLWTDLRDGMIRQGNRAGRDLNWARSGLMDCIPVDDQGNLLPPLLAGTIVNLPTTVDAKSEWEFGDGAPVENAWINSIEYEFAAALTGYLMKPARFIEQGWDPLRTVSAGSNDTKQYLYIDTNSRRSSSRFYVHRENPSSINEILNIPNESNLTFFGSWGIQHWISEYLISQNLSVTTYMGNLIRGSYGVLAHKVGGFISTDNSLRVTADSFGQLGYTNQLIPSENIQAYIYRSTSLGVYFYSGVIVSKINNGWKVYGYDGITPTFTTIPSIQTGPKINLVIGNQSVTEYQTGQGTLTVPYGTIFGTRQEVYDFLISYGRWLENNGWVFDTVNQDSGNVINWRQSAKDFMYWSQGNWDNGNFVALSPAANGVKFRQDFGSIQYVNGTIGGTYPVLDKLGQPIETQNVEVLRQDGEILVNPINNQTIFGLRLFMTSVEHILLFDNVTQFNDLIYDPLYNIYQPRLKVYGYRTNGWTGRLDAPGYFLYQDLATNQWKMVSNFEKTAEDFRLLYNIDQPKNVLKIDNTTGNVIDTPSVNHAVTNSDLSSLASHLIGYQSRDYLQSLLLDKSTEFEFYQGFIRQKGSRRVLNTMLRNTSILGNGEVINYYEEFAFRTGRYGAVSLNCNIDFILPQSEFVNNPQRIDVFSYYDSTQPRDGVIEITARDPAIVVPPENYEGKLFPLRASVGNNFYEDLPTAGYLQLGETTYYVVDQTALLNFSYTLIPTSTSLNVGDTIWQFITDNLSWTVWKVASPTSSVIGTITTTVDNTTVINFKGPHGIVNGDIIVTSNFINNDTLNGTFTAQNVTVDTITLPVSTFISENSGTVQVYRSIRYHSKTDLESAVMLNGWTDGDIVYVDNGESENQWTVYKRHLNKWEPIRTAQSKVNADLMLESKLYNKTSLSVVAYLEYFDPAKGFIPGTANTEITYKNVFDPAKYNNGDTAIYSIDSNLSWADSHVGEVWWDLSTTRYIDYEQGSTDYKSKNWGKLAPGTTIDIYEWVRSPVPPSDWASYATSQATLSQYGFGYTLSGVVRNAASPAWTQTTEYDSNGNSNTWYYFWVGHSDMRPTVPTRSLTTNEITNIIINPLSNGISWYAAISERSLIVCNINQYLKSDDTVIQLIYTSRPNDDNDYKEWSLVRSGDGSSLIDEQFWSKLRDSLTGYDLMDNCVPDPYLNELQRYGTLIRPRQSWFINRLAALRIGLDYVNNALLKSLTPLVTDTEKSSWITYFNQGEPLPPSVGNWDYKANDMSSLNLLSHRVQNGARVLVLPTVGNNNMWTIWTWYDSLSQFVLTKQQSYNVQNYWSYVDWYYTGFDSNTIPTYTVNTLNDVVNINLSGTQTIKVLDYGSTGWALLGLVNGIQQVVGLQDSTIQISDNLWNTSANLTGWDQTLYDSAPFDYNPTIEIGIIFDGIRYGIFGSADGIDLNNFFFTMINYVFSEQKYVDWVFKTSFMVLSGSNEPLTMSQLYTPSTVDTLLNYINEAKPYRSKVREFLSGRTAMDTPSIELYDFDKPPYHGSILNENDSYDANIMANNSTYSSWYNNYKTNPNLIRNLKTTLVFDRVASMPTAASIINAYSSGNTVTFTVSPDYIGNTFTLGEIVTISNVIQQGNTLVSFASTDVVVTSASGNVIVGYYSGNIGIGSGVNGSVFHQTYGAADRIMKLYSPSLYLPPIDSPDLISGTDFKGQVYSGNNFNMTPGWGLAPWDFASGWDADATAFDSYLEIILEGGMPPVYDQFYGNGITKQFRLSKIPQDMLHTKIWRDGVILTYGIDYKIPNWATGAEVAEPGNGYQVGEILDLLEDIPTSDSSDIQVKVTQVTSLGAIKKVEVVNKGFYNIVQHNPYITGYKDYQVGNGSGAIIQPIWGGQTLAFVDPPLDSNVPNIWVLYAGTTFEPAPTGDFDIITDGGDYIQPNIEENHPEELYKTKLRDAMVLDTYTIPVGGRPIVSTKSYVTDGRTDHYDLGLRPQSTSAVLAYLNGSMLYYGPFNDYVINFETGTLVFILPPASGQNLIITTFGEGGSGSSILSVNVVNSGENYSINDSIVLGGGIPALLGDGSQNAAKVTVTNITAVNAHIISNGQNYKIGDILILSNNGIKDTDAVSKLIIVVDQISKTGAILSVSIQSPGNYTNIPTNIQWQTSSKGSGVVILLTWGVLAVSLVNPGLYVKKPSGNFTQSYIYPQGGSGVEFSPIYTSIVDRETFVADGQTGTYTLNNFLTEINNVMVTANGSIIPSSNVKLQNNTITIVPPPIYGSFIVATVFNTDQYSTVLDTEFTANVDVNGNLITTYSLLNNSFNTVPDYSTVIVSVNGSVLAPPTMDTGISNGYSREFSISYQPADLSYLNVYVDGVLQVLGVDYNVINQNVIFTYDIPVDSVFVSVITDPYYGFEYTLNGASITFNVIDPSGFDEMGFDDLYGFDNDPKILENGDLVSVTNFSQDLSYQFFTEQFIGNSTGKYELAGEPDSESTLLVIVDNVVQRVLWDYALIVTPLEGFDTQGYELALFDEGSETIYTVVFNQNIKHTDQNTIIIRYMKGKSEQPATAFRQFISSSNYKQSQVLSDNSKTILLSNIHVNTSEIDVADISILSMPSALTPGSIWVNNEKIDFYGITPNPTLGYPNRGYLTNIVRGSGGTSIGLTSIYNTLFYNGNGTTKFFSTPSSSSLHGESVLVNNKIQAGGNIEWTVLDGNMNLIYVSHTILSVNSIRVYIESNQDILLGLNFDYTLQPNNIVKLNTVYPANTVIRVELDSNIGIRSNYYIGINPPTTVLNGTFTPGRYVVFDNLSIPSVGFNNILISDLVSNFSTTTVCHISGSMIRDAGHNVIIPGGYNWEAATNGLQYSNSSMSKFILNHPGTVS